MTCECNNYINCNDPPVETGIMAEHETFSHVCKNTTVVSNMPFEFTVKLDRKFSASWSTDRAITATHTLRCGTNTLSCDNSMSTAYSSFQSESCSMETNVLFFIDRQRELFVWKNVIETLAWSERSNSVAAFKMKWGQGGFYKICIKNSVRTQGKETFYMANKGSVSVLAEATYDYNPFPPTGPSGTWGLYGDTVSKTATPDTENVACILLFPTVPKQAIPLDHDVLAYGFYDYNAVDGGFVSSNLPELDGGKDYFYPEWLRAMPIDPLFREAADGRYGKYAISEGTTVWYPPSPVVNALPFGSLTKNSNDDLVISALLQFGPRVDNKGIVYNYTSFGDLFSALTTSGITLKSFTKIDPVVPL